MMNSTKRIIITALVVVACLAPLVMTAEASVGALYLTNNGDYAGHVWVDAKHQPMVPSGQTRYAVSGGRVGGWDSHKNVQVVIASPDEKGANGYSELNLSSALGNEARLWCGGSLALNDTDRKNADKTIFRGSGNGPVGLLTDAPDFVKRQRDENESGSTGAPGAGPGGTGSGIPGADSSSKDSARHVGNVASNGGMSFKNSIGMVMVSLPMAGANGGYWVGKYEVTQAEYQKVMGNNPSEFAAAKRPVERVSWNDAVAFTQRLTEIERKAGTLPKDHVYSLPTETQWEYFVGDAQLKDAVTSKEGRKNSTEPVGSLGANNFGLHDVRGNVWEWCLDMYDKQQDWHGLRGASWRSDFPGLLAVSYRDYCTPEGRRNHSGFRCVLVGGLSSSSR